MRAWRMFRVVLDGKGRETFMAHALQAVIVEIDMGNFNLVFWQAFAVETETVILGGYFNVPGGKVFNRLITSTVTKF